MKLSALIKKSRLLGRFIKLRMLSIPMIWVTSLECQAREKSHLQGKAKIKDLKYTLSRFTDLFRRQFLNKDLPDVKCIVVDYEDCRPIGVSLNGFVACAWVCEKMKINIKIKKPNSMLWRHFEKDQLINNTDKLTHKSQPSARKKFFKNNTGRFGTFFISSAFGHKIVSKLAINQYLERCANQWSADNLKGDWVAVHYRGTDVVKKKNMKCRWRYRLDLDSYITYLKEVIGDQYSIFACSDQAQFIDKMRIAFPSKVFSRDIERSYDKSPIHRHFTVITKTQEEIDHFNQEKDALIDLLILAKAKLIYTTGSGFADATRYFNPQIKIISLDQRRIGRGKNNVPMPRKDLYDSLCRPLKEPVI